MAIVRAPTTCRVAELPLGVIEVMVGAPDTVRGLLRGWAISGNANVAASERHRPIEYADPLEIRKIPRHTSEAGH